MALRVQNTIVVDDSRVLSNVGGLKTINGHEILGTGNVVIETDLSYEQRSNNIMLTANDKAKFIDITSNSFNQTIDVAANLGTSWWCYVKNSGNGDIDLNTTTSSNVIRNSNFSLGSELIVDGGFDSPSNWLLGTNWTISGGKLIASNAASDQLARPRIAPLTTNNTYIISFDVVFYAGQTGSNSLDVDFAQNSSPTSTQQSIASGITANGTYTYTHYATNSPYTMNTIVFSGGVGDFWGQIDNVSVKRVEYWKVPDASDIIVGGVNKLNLFGYVSTTMSGSATLKQNTATIAANSLVEISLDVSNYSSGVLIPVLGNSFVANTYTAEINIASNGTHTITIPTKNFTTNVIGFITGSSAFNAHISNISAVYKTTNVDDWKYPFRIYPNEMRLLMSNGSFIKTEVITPFKKLYTESDIFVKPPGYNKFGVFAVGGGGGGQKGSSSDGGGKGGDLVITSVNFPNTYCTVFVGAGGAPSTNTSNTSGGDTRLGNYVVALGAVSNRGTSVDGATGLGMLYLEGTGSEGDTPTIAPTGGGNQDTGVNSRGGRNRTSFGIPDNSGAIEGNGTSISIEDILNGLLVGGTGGGSTIDGIAGNGGFPGGGGGSSGSLGTPGRGADGVLMIWGEK